MSAEHEGYKPRVVLYDEAKEKSRKRYERIQYRNLVLKSALSFILGMLLCYFFKQL